jgi:ribosomal protein L13E
MMLNRIKYNTQCKIGRGFKEELKKTKQSMGNTYGI